jgi:hypothetical protein
MAEELRREGEAGGPGADDEDVLRGGFAHGRRGYDVVVGPGSVAYESRGMPSDENAAIERALDGERDRIARYMFALRALAYGLFVATAPVQSRR